MKLVFPIVAAAVASATHVPMEYDASAGLRGLPSGWKKNAPSPQDQKIELLFAVKQRNLDKLESTLMSVSDPDSPLYGRHLSNAAVHALVAPEDTHIVAVKTFLKGHGVLPVSVTSNEDFIRADVTVKQAEAILSTQYYEMEHGSGHKVHRAMKYSLPEDVASALDFVAPTVHFPNPKKARKQPIVEGQAPLVNNSPTRLRELYSVGTAEGNATDNKMAVTAFLDQYYSESDLKLFWSQNCNGIKCGKGSPKLVGDATEGRPAGIESMLDIETITGVAGNIESEFWGFSGESPDNAKNEPFLTWLAKMDTTDDDVIPKIFSTSYGEDEASWGIDAANRLNVEFQKQGARGISLLFAAGDEGANCQQGKYIPETPASSPWVTAVGGTQSRGNTNVETAIGLGSGGFSDRWAMPDWQKSAVDKYLKTASGLPAQASRGYNISGRAYPDISAQASNYDVIAGGRRNPGVAGTSCASPAASGIIALLNDARLAAGQPVLGFLNPFIYKNIGLWNDITAGNNNGCSFGGGNGWPASAGWDAATGVGTPNYAKLVGAALATPASKPEFA